MAPQRSSSSLEFEVKRCQYELVGPANPTPRELKMLSAIDSQTDNRVHVPIIMLFRYEVTMAGKDPVDVIRQALAKTLVFYYPLAGRLRENPDGKLLLVDCTSEGVIFIEADADVTLEEFQNKFYPRYPCYGEFLYNVSGSDGIIDSPLLLIQITRLKCGGFIFAMRFNHTMCDATGISLFLKGLGEIACGEPKPTILPVWNRELLCARNPPRITCLHHEYEQVPPVNKSNFVLHTRSFFFGPTEITAIRHLLPPHLKKSTSFEVLTAFLWRCRTIALKFENRNQKVRFLCVVNARYGRCCFSTQPLPDGFYGNAFAIPTAITTVGKLCNLPLEYALELVKKTKNEASEEYVQSVLDLLAIRKSPSYSSTGVESFEVSDMTKAGMEDVNFGWGKTINGGISCCSLMFTPYVPYTNPKGEKGRMVLICLPKEAMQSFVKQVDDLLKHQK